MPLHLHRYSLVPEDFTASPRAGSLSVSDVEELDSPTPSTPTHTRARSSSRFSFGADSERSSITGSQKSRSSSSKNMGSPKSNPISPRIAELVVEEMEDEVYVFIDVHICM